MMPGEILGMRIVAVRQVQEYPNPPDDWDSGLDFAQTYLELETGRVMFFVSSVADEVVSPEVMPVAAKRVDKQLERKLVGRRIVQMYRRMLDDGDRDGESVILALDDGTYVTETCVAPKGLGVGLCFYSREEFLRFLEAEVELFWKGDGGVGG